MNDRPLPRFVQRLPTRRRFLGNAAAGALGLYLAACREREAPAVIEVAKEPWQLQAETSLTHAANWLWDQQRENGVFPSSKYGILRDGQSLTPFSLLALLQIDPALYPLPVDAAIKALVRMVQMCSTDGALGLSNTTPDYPCYATSMMLTCLGLLKPDGWAEAASISSTWLRGQQFRKAAGWEGHAAEGGWGLGERTPRTPPDAGHVDLSMTRAVLEGLQAVKIDADDGAFSEAAGFVARCQTDDGSFVYSPVELGLNKAGSDGAGGSLGYGSATTDGLLSLIALGRHGDDPALVAAHDWLVEHHRVDRNPGLDGGPMEAFAEAMRGYYRAGAAECFMLTGGPAGWRPALVDAIAAEQRDDGRFENPNPLQKEDDPIIATGFAIRALAASLRANG